MLKKIVIVFAFPLFLFSCEELSELSEELKVLKNNQDIILKQQTDLMQKIVSLEYLMLSMILIILMSCIRKFIMRLHRLSTLIIFI